MANNIYPGFNVAIAKQSISFVDAGILTANTNIIYRVRPSQLISYVPGRGINGIVGFEENETYYMIATAGLDLSDYLALPFPELGNAILMEDEQIIETEP